MKLEKLIKIGEEKLNFNGIKTSNLDSKILLSYVLGSKNQCFEFDKEITPDQKFIFEKHLNTRIKGKPISRIIKRRSFWKDDFYLNDYTLDPRPDSEAIVEEAIIFIKKIFKSEINILELGTGTGCMILSILREFDNVKGLATDISLEAIKVALKNSKRLNLEKKLNFIVCDWCKGIKKKFDVIILNPPYIKTNEISTLQVEVKHFDPIISLDGGGDGLKAFKEISKHIKKLLKNNGKIFCEIGYNQANDVIEIFRKNNLKKVFIKQDLSGKDRCIVLSH